mmetsp:Transcript_78536/g.227003  ORF Transcript_78536/g.227003 Transcript_78536/m.227003 type:complete len:113 (+) Transcript_78536:1403-1741(+)
MDIIVVHDGISFVDRSPSVSGDDFGTACTGISDDEPFARGLVHDSAFRDRCHRIIVQPNIFVSEAASALCADNNLNARIFCVSYVHQPLKHGAASQPFQNTHTCDGAVNLGA